MVPLPLSLTLRMWLRISLRNWRQCTGTSTPHVSNTQISKPSVVCCFLFCLLQNFLRQYKFASLLLFLLFHKAWHCSLQCFEKRFRKDRLLWLVSPSQVRAFSATLAGRGRSPYWAAPGPSAPGARGYPRPWVGGCKQLDTPTWHQLDMNMRIMLRGIVLWYWWWKH